jgi:hypothetical protein
MLIRRGWCTEKSDTPRERQPGQHPEPAPPDPATLARPVIASAVPTTRTGTRPAPAPAGSALGPPGQLAQAPRDHPVDVQCDPQAQPGQRDFAEQRRQQRDRQVRNVRGIHDVEPGVDDQRSRGRRRGHRHVPLPPVRELCGEQQQHDQPQVEADPADPVVTGLDVLGQGDGQVHRPRDRDRGEHREHRADPPRHRLDLR